MSKEMRMERAYKEAAALTGFCNWDEEARIAMIENSMAAELGNAADKEEINMFSLVIIGNSQTYVQEGWMVTPRGYEKKEQL